MRSPRKSSNNCKPESLSTVALFILAVGVASYSVIVPLLALESLYVAESLLEFGFLHQTAILLLVMFSLILVLGRCATDGWDWNFLLVGMASVLLLGSVRPAKSCCSSLVAWIAGSLAVEEMQFADVAVHLMPICGSGLLLVALYLRRNVGLAGRIANRASKSNAISRNS